LIFTTQFVVIYVDSEEMATVMIIMICVVVRRMHAAIEGEMRSKQEDKEATTT
jgi:hypothetical protein